MWLRTNQNQQFFRLNKTKKRKDLLLFKFYFMCDHREWYVILIVEKLMEIPDNILYINTQWQKKVTFFVTKHSWNEWYLFVYLANIYYDNECVTEFFCLFVQKLTYIFC